MCTGRRGKRYPNIIVSREWYHIHIYQNAKYSLRADRKFTYFIWLPTETWLTWNIIRRCSKMNSSAQSLPVPIGKLIMFSSLLNLFIISPFYTSSMWLIDDNSSCCSPQVYVSLPNQFLSLPTLDWPKNGNL